jgi:hypothetical protein
VKPRELIGEAEVPGGPPLRLVSHDGAFIIMLDRNELMSSRMSGSEKALATHERGGGGGGARAPPPARRAARAP